MLWNYVKFSLRHVLNHPVYALLNVGGLALGIAAAFVLSLYVRQEVSYDRHLEDHERIYRVAADFFNMGGFAKSQRQLLDFLPQASPEVELATRFDRVFRPTPVIVGDRTYEEPHAFFVDSTYFRMFSYRFIEGDRRLAMNAPDEVILSERAAEKYFGSSASAIGQTLQVGKDRRPYRVNGVVKSPSGKTHLLAEMWLPLELSEQDSYWTNVSYYNYVRLRPGGTREDLERALDILLREHAYPASGATEPFETWAAGSHAVKFYVQPLADIYLHSDFRLEIAPGGNPTLVYSLGVIGLFILLIAGFNYVNLTTARSSVRAKEVGIKKTLGADRHALVQQFLAESIVFSLLAMVVAAALAHAMLAAFAFITGAPLIESVLGSASHVAALAGFSVIVGLLAGLYPAVYLSGFRPAKILKGDWIVQGNQRLRNGLVVIQFSIATGLGIATLVIFSQISFLQEVDKGFDHEGVLVIENAGVLGNSAEAFRREIDRQPQVIRSSFSGRTPTGSGVAMHTYRTPAMEESITIQTFSGDEHYIPTLGMRLVAGRNFSGDLASDSTAAILNESAVRALGLGDDPLDQEINEGQRVIGVVSDFHYQSLREKIEPVVLLYAPRGRELLLKLATGGDIVARLPALWEQFSPEEPIRHTFVDDNFARLADQERTLSRAVSFFTVLAMMIACVGLFGLTAFTMQRRTKEIGIRKVVGATIVSLVVLLSKDIARLVLIAFVVATPIAFVALSRWLDGFAYRIELGAVPFLVGGLAAIGIALMTVSYQAVRTALADPVKSLRYE